MFFSEALGRQHYSELTSIMNHDWKQITFNVYLLIGTLPLIISNYNKYSQSEVECLFCLKPLGGKHQEEVTCKTR